MDTAAFEYDLPEDRIAQHPVEPRDAARLLVDRGPGAEPEIEHRHVRDLADLVDPGDLVVVNRTRVLAARLHLRKDTGGLVEVLLLEPVERQPAERVDGTGPGADGGTGTASWEALVRPGRRVPPGTELVDDPLRPGLRAVVGETIADGVRVVHLTPIGGSLADALARVGEIPLPPYIKAPLVDPDRYQTVFSDRRHPESVAAPTAGLHLTGELTERLAARGAQVCHLELVVGLGTFRPIGAERIEDHQMHAERYRVPEATLVACRETRAAGGRVVAIGTTVVRALESAAVTGEAEGRTDLFVHGDYPFAVVDRLLTNFHTPRSSLLVMIDAFAGPRWRDLYASALAEGYRFLSFGDAMLLTRQDRW